MAEMGDSSGIIDILIFGVIAVFLVIRLVGVLGRRTGTERPRINPFTIQVPPSTGPIPPPHPYAAPPAAAPTIEGKAVEIPPHDGPVSLVEGLRRIQAADPAFNEQTFLNGARSAFTMILGAFAAGDLNTLRGLLADAVYADFARAIQERQRAGETLQARVAEFDSVDLTHARLVEGQALCTVRFVTHQENITRAADGRVVDGPADGALEEVTDIWTFARDTRSKDPNWRLVETRLAP